MLLLGRQDVKTIKMLALSLAPSFLPKIALLHEPKSEELERSQIIHSVHLLPWWNHVSLDTRPELSVGPVLPTWLLHCLASLLSSTLKVQKQKLTFPVCEEKQERKTNKRGSIGGGNSPGHPFCGSWCPHLHHLLGGERDIASCAWPRYLCVRPA